MSQAPNILHKVPRPVVIGELQTCVDYNVTALQKRRRERMIDFLENECPVEAFCFAVVDAASSGLISYYQWLMGRNLRPHCGTVGCAMGHARHLFRHNGARSNYGEEACVLFGLGYRDPSGWLNYEEGLHVFTPTDNDTDLPPADDDATPQQVATRLREAFRRHPAAI